MATISGYGYYASIQVPKLKYQSEDKEYSVQVLLKDEAEAKAWNKQFKKQKAKSFDAEEFAAQFKVAPPFESDEYFTVSLKREATYKDGNPLKTEDVPKVYLKNAAGKLVPTESLVGNGSQVVVSFIERTNDYGVFAKLKNVRVDVLVPYAGKGGDDTELGEFESGASDFAPSPPAAPTSAPKASAAPTPKVLPKKPTKAAVDDSDDGDASPF